MKIPLHLSAPHTCAYFCDRIANTLFIETPTKLSTAAYQALLNQGFRRSGKIIYKPHCQNCNACVPLRIDTKLFTPSRSLKRVLNKNRDVSYRLEKSVYLDEHYRLYKKYLKYRHQDGEMQKHTKFDYYESMIYSQNDTTLVELRLDEQLIGVCVTDIVSDGLSAVYTFFDPVLSVKRSLGSLAIVKQIELAKSMHKSFLYLGYWIENSKTMAYKSRFSASQILIHDEWKTL